MRWWNFVILCLILAAIAFGTNWMAYEQLRANSGFFIPAPIATPPPAQNY